MKKRALCLIPPIFALILTACSLPFARTASPTAALPTAAVAATNVSPTAPPAIAAGTVPRYEPAACRFGNIEGHTVACGYLIVPEDRAQPGGRTIRLHVAVFKAESANPALDPIVYLDGGPGSNPLELAPLIFNRWFGAFVAQRDVILFDQRGTGYSEPALDCPELVRAGYDMLPLNISRAEAAARNLAALQACRERLTREGVNLAAYTNIANAADLNDLRVALGYTEWNLYGISYGTRLALTAMRDVPSGIRSVILDSAYPPQSSEADLPANADRAFRALFARCAADAACNRAYPELERVFYETVERLERDPVEVRVTNPYDGKDYTVLMNGQSLISALFQMLYDTDNLPQLPKLIYAAHEKRDYTEMTTWAALWLFASDYFSYGMFYSVECISELGFSTRAELVAAAALFPRQLDAFNGDNFFDQCQQWVNGSVDARENQAVESAIPTLVLAGELDPVTPPDYGRLTAATLRNSAFFEFPAMGHGVSIAADCPRDIALAFVANPTAAPSGACIAGMPTPVFE